MFKGVGKMDLETYLRRLRDLGYLYLDGKISQAIYEKRRIKLQSRWVKQKSSRKKSKKKKRK